VNFNHKKPWPHVFFDYNGICQEIEGYLDLVEQRLNKVLAVTFSVKSGKSAVLCVLIALKPCLLTFWTCSPNAQNNNNNNAPIFVLIDEMQRLVQSQNEELLRRLMNNFKAAASQPDVYLGFSASGMVQTLAALRLATANVHGIV
jgi:hypothetical protein